MSTLHLSFYCFYSYVVIFEQHLAQEFPSGFIKFYRNLPDTEALSDSESDVFGFPQHAGHITITDATVSMLDLR